MYIKAMEQNTSHAVMAQRHESLDSLDDFPTPPWATRALLEHVIGDEEYESMGCNVLALDSNTAIMGEGNPITKSKLESEGIKVLTYPGNEISVKGTGGPTCLTRPLLRMK